MEIQYPKSQNGPLKKRKRKKYHVLEIHFLYGKPGISLGASRFELPFSDLAELEWKRQKRLAGTWQTFGNKNSENFTF
jgi:hypothetical protein